MHRRLIVMRHAKSSWTAGVGGDHARPLDDRGRHEAAAVAAELRARGWVPEQVLSSDATRTRETLSRMVDTIGVRPVTWSRALYNAALEPFVEEVGLVAADVGTLLVLGHNPGWEEITAWLTGVEVRFTTANAALLTTDDGPWAETMRPRAWHLEDVIRPAEL